jgi:hypothetical protein
MRGKVKQFFLRVGNGLVPALQTMKDNDEKGGER